MFLVWDESRTGHDEQLLRFMLECTFLSTGLNLKHMADQTALNLPHDKV